MCGHGERRMRSNREARGSVGALYGLVAFLRAECIVLFTLCFSIWHRARQRKKNVVGLGSRKTVVIKRNMVGGLEKGRLELGRLVWGVFF